MSGVSLASQFTEGHLAWVVPDIHTLAPKVMLITIDLPPIDHRTARRLAALAHRSRSNRAYGVFHR